MTLIDAARRYHAAGLHLLPNHPTEKYPSGYREWQSTEFSLQLIERHIRDGGALGLRAGDEIEVVDVDVKAWLGNDPDELRRRYEELVERNAPGLLLGLAIAKTRSGGRHYLYRCLQVGRNQPLARRPPTPEELAREPKLSAVTLIETRGNGGQVQIAPSPGYELLQGDYDALPEITPEEREILFNCARALSQHPKTSAERLTPDTTECPGDHYNRNGGVDEALELLQAQGWSVVSASGGTTYLTRPGGTRGHIHASYGHIGPGIFYPFTTNCAPFEPETAYSPFAVLTVLQHGGDFSACARELALRYGLSSVSTMNSGNSGNSGDRSSAPEPWSPPIPFREYDLPAFPINTLPLWLRLFVLALALATQTPVDLTAMLAFAVLATACQKKIIVQVSTAVFVKRIVDHLIGELLTSVSLR